MTAEIASSRQGDTLVLTLSNPAVRNALEPGMYAAGVEALNVAGADPTVRCVVITGAGATFSAGGHLRQIAANRGAAREQQAQRIEALHNWIEALDSFPKPVLAAVEGHAAGAGFALALACDLIVAARDAQFLLPQVRLGLTPDGGATWHLLHKLPRAVALELMLLGQASPASRLYELGLVNRLSEPGHALRDALALAGALAECAPNAQTGVKTLVAGMQSTLSEQLRDEREAFLNALGHPNAGIGLAAALGEPKAPFRTD